MSQSALTFVVSGHPILVDVLMVEWSSTVILYNVTIFLSLPSKPALSSLSRTRWVGQNLSLMRTLTIIAAAILLYFASRLSPYSVAFLIVIGIVASTYFVPIVKIKGRWRGLREVPGLKVFHIVFVWVLSTVFLPLIELHAHGLEIAPFQIFAIAVSRFLFLLICTLPFDMRDMTADRSYELRTIPLIFGEKVARTLVYGLIAVHSVWVFSLSGPDGLIGAFLFTNLLLVGVLRFYVFKSENYLRTYLLDFALIMQFLIVYLGMKL